MGYGLSTFPPHPTPTTWVPQARAKRAETKPGLAWPLAPTNLPLPTSTLRPRPPQAWVEPSGRCDAVNKHNRINSNIS